MSFYLYIPPPIPKPEDVQEAILDFDGYDYQWKNFRFVWSWEETPSGDVVFDNFYVKIENRKSANQGGRITAYADKIFDPPHIRSHWRMKYLAEYQVAYPCICWATLGYVPMNVEVSNASHVGFKIIDGDLYATAGDGSGNTALLIQKNYPSTRQWLEVDFIVGQKAIFYIEKMKVAEISTNLPVGAAIPIEVAHFSLLGKTSNLTEVKIFIVKVLVPR